MKQCLLPFYESLSNKLNYNPETGVFSRLLKNGQTKICGTVTSSVYIQLGASLGGSYKTIKSHRLAWYIYYGELANMIDYINGNGLDNSIMNLRLATPLQNSQNSKMPTTNTSGRKGVYWNKNAKKWVAQIRKNKKVTYLGSFDDIELASECYKKEAKEYFKEFYRA